MTVRGTSEHLFSISSKISSLSVQKAYLSHRRWVPTSEAQTLVHTCFTFYYMYRLSTHIPCSECSELKSSSVIAWSLQSAIYTILTHWLSSEYEFSDFQGHEDPTWRSTRPPQQPGAHLHGRADGGLDPGNARRIKNLIHDQKQNGRTVFLTTHDMTVADELCDRVAFIVDGKIRLIESPRDLKLVHGARTVLVEYGAEGRSARQEFLIEDLGENAAFLALLRGGKIHTLHTQEATLEDVFIRVTGFSLQRGVDATIEVPWSVDRRRSGYTVNNWKPVLVIEIRNVPAPARIS